MNDLKALYYSKHIIAMLSYLVLVVLLCIICERTNSFSVGKSNFLIRGHQSNVVIRYLAMEFSWKQVKKQSEEKMVKSVENIQSQFNTLRVILLTLEIN